MVSIIRVLRHVSVTDKMGGGGEGAGGIYIRHPEGGKGSMSFDGIRQGGGRVQEITILKRTSTMYVTYTN